MNNETENDEQKLKKSSVSRSAEAENEEKDLTKLSTYDYYLPEELIAQDPLKKRSDSRLMILHRDGSYEDKHFYNIIDYLNPGDCLVINNTKVIPARLIGARKKTGGKVEILLLKRITDTDWETLVKPGKSAKEGDVVEFGNGLLEASVIEVKPDGNRIVRFSFDGIFEEILDKLGQMPIPPYIKHELKDKDRYQTVYAKYDGSAAAPTAGLHFTKELLKKIKEKGVDIAEITLHVGLGTFRPVKVDDVREHEMHSEYYVVNKEAADKINKAHDTGHRVIAVGTTSTRTLETVGAKDGRMRPSSGDTSIFIYPGFKYMAIDALITNFHLPKSTLIMLVSAFSSREKILNAYHHAVEEKYRFFSFGDAMLIEK